MTQGDDKESNLLLLGRAVKTMREQRSMSREDLAEACGAPPECVAALETGQLDPTYDLLVDIADGLNIQPSTLVILAERLGARPD